jgi:hypothetical protein
VQVRNLSEEDGLSLYLLGIVPPPR